MAGGQVTVSNTPCVDPSVELSRLEKVVRYNIRRYCRLMNRSQNSLAPALGITSGAISQMMTGTGELKLGKVYLIAKELGVSIDDLLDDKYLKQDEEFLSRLPGNKETAVAGNLQPRLFINPVPPVGLAQPEPARESAGRPANELFPATALALAWAFTSATLRQTSR